MKTFWRCRRLFLVCLPVCFAICAAGQQADSGQSLGDVARKLRKDTTNEVKMTDADTKKLFEAVDRIFAFAAEDTGMPKHAAVMKPVTIPLMGSNLQTNVPEFPWMWAILMLLFAVSICSVVTKLRLSSQGSYKISRPVAISN